MHGVLGRGIDRYSKRVLEGTQAVLKRGTDGLLPLASRNQSATDCDASDSCGAVRIGADVAGARRCPRHECGYAPSPKHGASNTRGIIGTRYGTEADLAVLLALVHDRLHHEPTRPSRPIDRSAAPPNPIQSNPCADQFRIVATRRRSSTAGLRGREQVKPQARKRDFPLGSATKGRTAARPRGPRPHTRAGTPAERATTIQTLFASRRDYL